MTADWLLLPVMPDWSWPLSWAVVAAAVVVWLWPRQTLLNAPRTTQTHRATDLSRSFSQPRGPAWLIGLMAACAAILAVWPHGGWSGYAALALQSPSLLTVTWAIVCLFQATGWTKPAHDHVRAPALAWILLCALGWLLTIDTLNLWPRHWDIVFTPGDSRLAVFGYLPHWSWPWHGCAMAPGYGPAWLCWLGMFACAGPVATCGTLGWTRRCGSWHTRKLRGMPGNGSSRVLEPEHPRHRSGM
jgi:hypothetical protein